MEASSTSNNSYLLMTFDDSSQPTVYFPAWGPAVTVAVAMLIFLAASFYIRHRKVVKKREILMDYFYIIFQYGGMRRKRMVAALCNTNAITLRELGRSFMISFDSIANSDNSCPFYLEEAHCPQGPNYTPGVNKKTFFRSRGMINGKKSRHPFRRYNTQDESSNLNPVSLQDILMRFKTRRTNAQSPTPAPSYRHGKLEGSSMCAIHGDDLEYPSYIEENEEPRYRRQRRNAYVAHIDSPSQRLAENSSEVGRHSLGNVLAPNVMTKMSPYPGKRNSEPWRHIEGGCPCAVHSHDAGHCQNVFQLNSERLSPCNVVCGSHGYIPKLSEAGSLGGSCCSYRNSEPAILIHPASIDGDPTQGWSDIRNKNTNGIVFLKKVPKGDGEFYYEEQKEPSVDLARRASLSKVSYVPSGNMNEYYNCLSSPKKTKANPPIGSTSAATPAVSSLKLEPTRGRRSRLSLGEIAVSNFNKRIEVLSESLHETSAHDSSMDSKNSQDSSAHHQHSKYKSTWLKFKNVFTGSRSTHSSKSSKSTPLLDDRHRKRNRRQDSRWKRFFSVLTGFRSLPETKVTSRSLDCPKCSVSVPSGLNLQAKCHSFDIESGLLDKKISKTILHDDQSKGCSNCNTIYRPQSMRLPAHARSVPEELCKLRSQYQQLKNKPETNDTSHDSCFSTRCKPKIMHNQATPFSLPLARKDMGRYNLKLTDSCYLEYKKPSKTLTLNSKNLLQHEKVTLTGSSDRLFSNRNFGNLSPLPESWSRAPSRTEGSISQSEGDIISEKSIYFTPSHFTTEKNFGLESGTFFNLLENTKVSQAHHYKSNECLVQKEVPLIDVSCMKKVVSETSLAYHAGHVVNDTKTVNKAISGKYMDGLDNNKDMFFSSINIDCNNEIMAPMQELLTVRSKLIPEQRKMGVSSETVYYDTRSAVSSPTAVSPIDTDKGFNEVFSLLPKMISAKNVLQSDSFVYFTSDNLPENAISVSPNQSQKSSPFVSRSPSPCQFWQNSPQLFSHAISGQLAVPTPVKNCNLNMTYSQIQSGVTSLNLTEISSNYSLSLNHDFDKKKLNNESKEKSSEHNISEYTTLQNEQVTKTKNDDSYGQCLQTFEHSESEILRDHGKKSPANQSSPAGSRNPTPTRSFSTPSPSFDKPSASPDEMYRANVSRLPRFARRASQGTPLPFIPNQVINTSRSGDRNGPLRECSIELKES